MYELFGTCATHTKALPGFLHFVKHANEVRKRTRKDSHPLIIYFNLESKEDIDFDTMKDLGACFGSVATMLSSKTDSCMTIVEFSKPAISHNIRRLRGSDQTHFEVNAMTEDEFLKIGKQVLNVSKDEQNITGPYLKHYHDWLGGHTTTLTDLATEAQPASMHTLCCLCTMLMNHPSFADVVS